VTIPAEFSFYLQDADGATPIAYLWARAIRCEGPWCGAEVPLIRSLWRAKKANRAVALRLRFEPAGEAGGLRHPRETARRLGLAFSNLKSQISDFRFQISDFTFHISHFTFHISHLTSLVRRHGETRLRDMSALWIHDAGGFCASATQEATWRSSRRTVLRGGDNCESASKDVFTGNWAPAWERTACEAPPRKSGRAGRAPGSHTEHGNQKFTFANKEAPPTRNSASVLGERLVPVAFYVARHPYLARFCRTVVPTVPGAIEDNCSTLRVTPGEARSNRSARESVCRGRRSAWGGR
jgi:hypothetical protein